MFSRKESVADSSLDDEQMMAVDEALSEVFRKQLEGAACCRKKQQRGEPPEITLSPRVHLCHGASVSVSVQWMARQ